MKNKYFSIIFTIALLVIGSRANAVIVIEIDEGIERGIPIAIVPFGSDTKDALPVSVGQVVRDDLARTGRFDPIPADQYLSSPTSAEAMQFNDWQVISADYVLIGRVEAAQDREGSYRVIARLYDAFEQKQVFGIQYIITVDKLRAAAHRIANSVFENITDELSSFDTQIVYTTTIQNDNGGAPEHALYLSDYDGHNPQIILRSEYPILSPAWSPDGTRVVYSELRASGSLIYVQTIATGERYAIATPEGQNSAPNWSPDGQRIVFSNSTEGNYDIYIISLADGKLTRVTDHRLIDTEPSWSPDGKHIVFTSNRGKDPQIYRAAAKRNAAAQRVTLEGRSNTGAHYSPSGEQLVLITDHGRGSQVGIFDFSTKQIRVISSTNIDDSAKFSPHGDMLIHVVEGRDRYIKILSPDGRAQTRVPVAEGRIKQVDWGKIHQQ